MKKTAYITSGILIVILSIFLYSEYNLSAKENISNSNYNADELKVKCPYINSRHIDDMDDSKIDFMTKSIKSETREKISADLMAIEGVKNVWLSETCPNTGNTLVKLNFDSSEVSKEDILKSLTGLGINYEEKKQCPHNSEIKKECPFKGKSENKEMRS